jgi:hypothetical protein
MQYSTDDSLKQPAMQYDYIELVEDFRFTSSFIRTMIHALEVEHHPGITVDLKQQVENGIAQTLAYIDGFFNEQLRILFSDSRWQMLARNQSEFDESLKHALEWIRSFIRARYGLKAHRPAKQEVRDFRIMILRTKGLEFPKIAKRLGMSCSAVHGAFDRQEERDYQVRSRFQRVYRLAKSTPELVAGPNGELLLTALAPLFD